MKKYLITIFLCLPLITNAQKMEKVAPIDISDRLSYEDFQEIKQFILSKGQTKTYCNMYNHNPYYRFSRNIELFLNPIFQLPYKDELKDPDTYNTIAIRDRDQDQNINVAYIDIVEDSSTRKIYLKPYWDTGESMKIKEKEVGKYIAIILKEIGQ